MRTYKNPCDTCPDKGKEVVCLCCSKQDEVNEYQTQLQTQKETLEDVVEWLDENFSVLYETYYQGSILDSYYQVESRIYEDFKRELQQHIKEIAA